MEAAARLARLRREAAEYYRGHRVPERMEEALNALFPRCPEDLYGELVARGGEAAGRGRGVPGPLPPCPQRGGGVSVVAVQGFAPCPGKDCDSSVFVARGTWMLPPVGVGSGRASCPLLVWTPKQSSPEMDCCLS